MSLTDFFNNLTDIFGNETVMTIASIVFFTLLSVGFSFFFIRRIRSSYGGESIKNGVTATATISRIWDTGTTINDDPLAGIELQVQPPNEPSFTAECKQIVDRLQVGYFQPGKIVTVSYDPTNHKKIHIIEVNTATIPDVVQSVMGPQAPATPAAIQQRLEQIDAANEALLKIGQPAPAQVLNYMDWNVHVNGENPAVTLQVQVNPPGKPPFMAQVTAVIAASSIPRYQPGCTIWVKYDPTNFTKVAIDHS